MEYAFINAKDIFCRRKTRLFWSKILQNKRISSLYIPLTYPWHTPWPLTRVRVLWGYRIPTPTLPSCTLTPDPWGFWQSLPAPLNFGLMPLLIGASGSFSMNTGMRLSSGKDGSQTVAILDRQNLLPLNWAFFMQYHWVIPTNTS